MKIKKFSERLYKFFEDIFIFLFLGFWAILMIANIIQSNRPAPSTEEQHKCPTTKVELQFPDVFNPPAFIETVDKEELYELIQMFEDREYAAVAMLTSAYELGYDEDHPVVRLAKKEADYATEMQIKYREIYETLEFEFWNTRMEENPVATSIWLYLKSLGYNDYICAGILGNIMAEVGGDTLDIQPYLYDKDKGYYGICQWSSKYYPDIQGADLNTQLSFLKDTIENEIDTFGHFHSEDFNYRKFIALEDIETAALAFARTYERCSPIYHTQRANNALVAYNYFVD